MNEHSEMVHAVIGILTLSYVNIRVFYLISQIKISFFLYVFYILYSFLVTVLFGEISFVFRIVFFLVLGHVLSKNKQTIQLYILYAIYTVLSLNVLSTVFYQLIKMFWKEGTLFLGGITWIDSLLIPMLVILAETLIFKNVQSMLEILRNNLVLQQKRSFLYLTYFLLTGGCLHFLGYLFKEKPLFLVIDIVLFVVIILLLEYLNTVSRVFLEQQLSDSKDRQLKELNDYAIEIEMLYRELQSFRHDYANILISLQDSIENNEIESIRHAYKTIASGSFRLINHSKYELGKLSDIKITEIKSLLSNKIISAFENDIHVNVEIESEIKVIYFSLFDFIRVISVLMDNAIEAALESEKPNISVIFFEMSEKKEQYFIVKNSTLDESVNLRSLQLGYSTKGSHRGLGLANIRKILEQHYNVRLETETRDFFFKQTLIIKQENDVMGE
ncbi:sensor histidine kinase [Enterococcus sp. N249-2]